MGAKKSKLNKEVLDELCSKTKFRNYFRDFNSWYSCIQITWDALSFSRVVGESNRTVFRFSFGLGLGLGP